MKKNKLSAVIFTTLLLISLAISGCTTDPIHAEVNDILAGTTRYSSGYSSGWVGLEVALKIVGYGVSGGNASASHTIIVVPEGTPASKAGIMVGDEIIRIGSENTAYMNTQEVAKRLSEAGSPLALLVKRKGQENFLSFVITKADTSSARQLEPPKGPTAGVSSTQAQEESKGATIGLQPTDILPYTTEWGFKGKYIADNGMLVQQIIPRSPAEKAGLKTGDAIIALNSVALKGLSDFARPPYVPVKMLVRREGTEIERTILPGGILKLKVVDLKPTFSIPGVPAHENPTAVSAIDALDFVNVLDRVVLDPKSGRIAVIGHYDKSYDTGRIPYLDLLKNAMANPLPILNLQETPDTKKEIISAGDKIHSNLKLMVDAVRGHPDFERERQIMIRELAKAYGLTPQEYVDWYNYVKLSKNKEILPPQPIRDIQLRVFSNLGYTDVATALELSFENTPYAAVKALEVLGHGEEARSILNSNAASTDGKRGELMAAAYLAIAQSANVVSAKELELLRDWYSAKKITWEVVIKDVQNLLMPYTPKGKKDSNIMVEAFTRIFLSPKAVQFLEGLPTPYVQVETIDLERTSQLARIMYEADYALKSLSVMPELFQNIPGSLSRMEYQNKHGLLRKGELDYHQWLEPKMVDMKVSPDHRVINFTSSQMRYLFADYSDYWKRPPNKELERGFAAWCDHFMENYDAYASIVPAFHKIREVAKVLALVKWARAEKIPLNLSSVTQEKWVTPEKVPAFWVLSQGIYGNGLMGTVRAFEGGVSFKTRGNWTQITPSATTTTEASAQLTLSAQIGRKAVQAATAGDLEKARYLSELSAQALAGGLTRKDLTKLNIAVPNANPASVSPVSIQLQKEMIKATHRQITKMTGNPASERQAAARLSEIDHIYKQIQDDPISASDYLKQLQTRQIAASASAPSQAPLTVAARPAVWAPCDDPAIRDKTLPLTPERRTYLNDRLFEARERLKYINTALKKLISIQEGQRAEIEKVTQDLSTAYDESVDRAWSVGFDLLTSLPANKFQDNYEVAKAKLNNAMKYRTGLLTTPLDEEAKKQIQSEILHIQVAKERLAEIYEGSTRLLDVFKDANYAYDFDKWTSQTQNDYKKVKDAAFMLGKIMLEPKLGKSLETKAFFAGEKYFQVAAMGRMAYYGMGFFLDILAQKLAWEPLTGRLQNDLKNNIQAMENLRQKASDLYREIGCIENTLR